LIIFHSLLEITVQDKITCPIVENNSRKDAVLCVRAILSEPGLSGQGLGLKAHWAVF
jgi:hypothetical protein